ncbi:MAG: hypothetical protein JXR94_20365 [Candidatus Hydrogenedentes bacterium]|nr:hypothetical protein [Candidatus Hydrogenedentota bacterium]
MIRLGSLLIAALVGVGGASEERAEGVAAADSYRPTEANRIEGRPADLWRYYMHGVVDHFAAPIDVTALVEEAAASGSLAVEKVEIQTPYGQWAGPGLRFEGTFHQTLAKPLPVPLAALRGKRIRLFFWEQGEATGRENSPNSYGDAPNLMVELRDREGRTLATEDTFVKTTGTFPWHCYHDDLFVPDDAEAAYLRFSNACGGAVWYAAFSWEPVTDALAFSKADRQDPLTGSLAYNPDYDALNWHLNRGMATRYTWNFFRGPSAGLKGQPYDVTTREGLARYFREKAKTDNDHLNHSLMYFASRYHYGKEAGVLPEGMDEAWLAELARLVVNDQDPATGYWGTVHTPRSMGITFHLTEGLFNYYPIRRNDREDTCNQGRHMGVLEIPRADRILETTLRMQCSVDGPDGAPRLAGWPRHAYNFTDSPNAGEERCSLVVTSNAIWMMQRCERFVDEDLRRRVYASVRAAVQYVLERCVIEDGTWVQSDTETQPTSSSYMKHIIETSPYLERKVDTRMAAPLARIARDPEGNPVVQWTEPRNGENSVRVYAAPAGMAPADLNESHLVGIIQRTGHRVCEMDPLVAVRTMSDGCKRRWGSGWSSRKGYLGWKLNVRAPKPLPFTTDLEPLRLDPVTTSGQRLYVSASTWYGEESSLLAESPDRPLQADHPNRVSRE